MRILSAVLMTFAILSTLCSFTHSLILMIIYIGAIGVIDGVYWTMLSLAAMEIVRQYSDIANVYFDAFFYSVWASCGTSSIR